MEVMAIADRRHGLVLGARLICLATNRYLPLWKSQQTWYKNHSIRLYASKTYKEQQYSNFVTAILTIKCDMTSPEDGLSRLIPLLESSFTYN